jgi:hypothetical protein
MRSPAIPHPGTHKGVTVEHDLKGLAIGQAHLIYRGKYVPPPPGMDHFEIEAEIYRADGVLSVHTVCPKCRHTLWINGKNKAVEYNPKTGTLHVEPFQCTWEMGEDRREFGFGLCNLVLAYDGKIAKDA